MRALRCCSTVLFNTTTSRVAAHRLGFLPLRCHSVHAAAQAPVTDSIDSHVSVNETTTPSLAPTLALDLTRGNADDHDTPGQAVLIGRMAQHYGTGNYQLFRAIYKDLCDEMRREVRTKPPPPIPTATISATTVLNEPLPSDQWTTSYQEANNLLVFRRITSSNSDARVVAYMDVELKNPPRLNALLLFADWSPIEVLIERNGVILHYSLACGEGGSHLRNLRVYNAADLRAPGTTGDDDADVMLMACTSNAQWVRQNLFYDGPCIWHLELDVQNELFDIMQDHGITLDFLHWSTQWLHYQEHVNYVRWSLKMLEELIPSSERGPEEDFLTEDERALLDEPSEEWVEHLPN